MFLQAHISPALIESLDQIAFAITGFCGSLMGLIAVGNLLARPVSNRRLAAAIVFLCMSAAMLSVGLGHRRFPDALLFLYGIHMPCFFLIVPVFRAYVLSLADPDDRAELRFPAIAWFVPAGVALLVVLPAMLMGPELKLDFLERRIDGPYLLIYRQAWKLLGFAGPAFIGLGAVQLFRELHAIDLIRARSDSPALWHLRVIVCWIALVMVLACVSQVLSSRPLKQLAMTMLCCGILWLFLLDYRYPGFFSRINQEARALQHRYKKSRIANLDTANITAKLERALVDENLYADEDLTLEKLALAVDIHPAQLSELLNNVMGVDFRQYVNEHRVNAAKRMLVQEPQRTVLSVGYAAGFNSRASFNRNFKAIVGRTPLEYRETQTDGA